MSRIGNMFHNIQVPTAPIYYSLTFFSWERFAHTTHSIKSSQQATGSNVEKVQILKILYIIWIHSNVTIASFGLLCPVKYIFGENNFRMLRKVVIDVNLLHTVTAGPRCTLLADHSTVTITSFGLHCRIKYIFGENNFRILKKVVDRCKPFAYSHYRT